MKITDIIASAITRAFSRQINKFIRVFQNLNKVRSKLYQYVNNAVKQVFSNNIKKPNSKGDYVKIGSKYFARNMIIVSFAAIIMFVFTFAFYIFPWMEGRLWIPTIVLNTPKFHTYSGKAKVVNSEGKLIYRGQLKEGRITGNGQQFDNEGNIVYFGDFAMEIYEGQGELYDKNEELKYKGSFNKGKFEGKGVLYNKGIIIYDGDFYNGIYDGNGILYDNNGVLVYKGNFAGGDYSGLGVLFYPNGREKYAGNFVLNEFHGEGKFYSKEGILIYEGNFANGKYNGKGLLYDPDKKSILYEGEFVNGLFQGQGKLYDADRRRILYEGSFEEGKYNGLGKLYNSQKGTLLYDGNFYDGEIDYLYFLNQETSIARQAFGEEDELVYFDDSFEIMYKDLRVSFVCNYSNDDSEPLVDKIIFAGNQKLYGTASGMKKSELEQIFDDIFTIADYYIDDIRKTHIGYFEIDERMDAKAFMYGIKFLKDRFYLRYYFSGEKDEVVFYEIGEVY